MATLGETSGAPGQKIVVEVKDQPLRLKVAMDEMQEAKKKKIQDQLNALAALSDRIADMATKARTIQNSGKLVEQYANELKQDLDARLAVVLKALQQAASA